MGCWEREVGREGGRERGSVGMFYYILPGKKVTSINHSPTYCTVSITGKINVFPQFLHKTQSCIWRGAQKCHNHSLTNHDNYNPYKGVGSVCELACKASVCVFEGK